MKDDFTRDDINDCLAGIERMTQMYKDAINSKEYQMGKRILAYKTLVKNREWKKLLKRLFNKNKSLNNYLETASYTPLSSDANWNGNKIAVYTSIFGDYDTLIEPLIHPNNIDYYIITDQEIPKDSSWKKLDVNEVFPAEVNTNIEKNRYVKMLPHKIFKDYEYSIYVDGNVLITSDFTCMIAGLDKFPVAMHRHKNRNCVYEEIEACIAKGKGLATDLIKHKELLLSNGVPRSGGLLEATVIARKHSDGQAIKLMNAWWDEFLHYSKRDQISLVDVLWKMNVSIDQVATLGNNILLNNHLFIVSHK